MQPTALVNEAFIRLTEQQAVSWQNRAHFYAFAAQMMRRVLINYAEAKHAEKRGGARARKVELGLDEPHYLANPRDRREREISI